MGGVLQVAGDAGGVVTGVERLLNDLASRTGDLLAVIEGGRGPMVDGQDYATFASGAAMRADPKQP